jgi:hypothetical protein
LAWLGLAWFGLVWFGLVWFGLAQQSVTSLFTSSLTPMDLFVPARYTEFYIFQKIAFMGCDFNLIIDAQSLIFNNTSPNCAL